MIGNNIKAFSKSKNKICIIDKKGIIISKEDSKKHLTNYILDNVKK